MTVNNENNTPQPITQDKVDTNLAQQNSDTNLTQKPDEIIKQNTEETVEDPNWKAFREARKRDRAEREAAEKRASEKDAEIAALKAAMETAFSKQAPTPQAYQQYYGMNQNYDQPEETEDQRIEKKVNKLLADREQKYRQEQEEYEIREFPNKLIKNYPDFSQVCSQENLDYLDFHYPELSRPLERQPEGYDKWSDIYHAVKKLIPNHANQKKEAIRADANSNKPKSMSTTQLSQTGQGSNRDTHQEIEQRRAENFARMQRIIKGIG
jgi:hypothetical protein